MADEKVTAFRELFVLGDHIPAGSSFSFTLLPDDSFVSFRRKDRSTALFVGRSNDTLSVSEKSNDGKWQAYTEPRPIEKDPQRVTVTLNTDTATVKCDALEADLTVPIGDLYNLCGSGPIEGLTYDEVVSPQVQEARKAVISTIEDLPKRTNAYRDNLIFDFGLWNGDDSAFYLSKGFDVVAIEANPILAQQGATRFAAEIAAGRMTIVNMGLADQCGSLPFYISLMTSEQSSFEEKMARRTGPVREQIVPTVTPDLLWDAFGTPFYAKIDIESFDRIVLESLSDLPRPPSYVSFEIAHEDWQSEMSRLCEYGYQRFNISDQQLVPQQTLPQPSRHGRFVDHTFSHGSSGSFGEELPGSWVAPDALIDLFKAMQAANPKNKGWFDVHAAFGPQ